MSNAGFRSLHSAFRIVMMRGALITFEGVEGSGKSTQARLLHEALQSQGIDSILTREPGGTPIGERIRDILLDPACREMEARTELLLYLASRHQHVREKLLPALRAGKVVISDRYSESSLAYQGGGRALSFRLVGRLNKFATGGLAPDLTLVVDVPPEVGAERMKGAPRDRLESERREFHELVRESYLALARRAPGRMKVLDGHRPQSELAQQVANLVRRRLVQKGIVRAISD
jgi:dTMP kinase